MYYILYILYIYIYIYHMYIYSGKESNYISGNRNLKIVT